MNTLSRPRPIQLALAAIRPATLTAAAAPVFVGSALAAAAGAFQLHILLLTLLAATAIQIGTNLYNDARDFERGADTDERLGPPRVTQRGWMTARQVRRAAYAAFLLAFLIGVYLAFVGGWPIIAIGLASILSGFAYTGGPAPLAYTGLADLFVILFFGLIATAGTFYLHTLSLSTPAILAGLAVGLPTTAILVVNNLRDRHTDARVDKKTLVVRFGPRFGRAEYTALLTLALLIPTTAALLRLAPTGWLFTLLAAPLFAIEIRAIHRTDGADLNPHLGRTARAGLLFSLLLAIGSLL